MAEFTRLNKIWLVEVVFWDHVKFEGEVRAPVKCQVPGYLYKESNTAYYLSRWVADGLLEDTNSETVCILKSTLIKPIKKILLVKEI